MRQVCRTACVAPVAVFVRSIHTQTVRSQEGPPPGQENPFPCDYGLDFCEKEVCEQKCIERERWRDPGSMITRSRCVEWQRTCYTVWEPCDGWPEGCDPNTL